MPPRRPCLEPLPRSGFQPPKQVQSVYSLLTIAQEAAHANTPPEKSLSVSQQLQATPNSIFLQEQLRLTKESMYLWYWPKFPREEAVSYLCDMDLGSFTVRDSVTLSGGYSLSVRVSPEQARTWRRLPKSIAINKHMNNIIICDTIWEKGPF